MDIRLIKFFRDRLSTLMPYYKFFFSIDMEMFAEDASFHAVMLDLLFTGPKYRKDELLNLVNTALALNDVQPLQYTVFSADEVEQAFRFMASGKHIGKVILKLRDEEEDKLAKPALVDFDVVPKFYASATKSYIVTGMYHTFRGIDITGL